MSNFSSTLYNLYIIVRKKLHFDNDDVCFVIAILDGIFFSASSQKQESSLRVDMLLHSALLF